MATSSIYTEVKIKDKASANKLIKAFEKSENKRSKEVVLSKRFEEVRDEKDIKKIFGDIE